MPDEVRLAVAFVLAATLTAAATPIAIRVARRTDFYDHPHGAAGYKRHRRSTPYLGGAALLVGLLVAGLAFGGAGSHAALWGGALALWALGTLDDRTPVRPAVRVAAELAAATALWATDLGWSLGAGAVVDLAITLVWVVAIVNAFNLMDNQDGAATVVGLASAVGLAGVALAHDDAVLAALALALAGACAGFLPFNLSSPSARIFLGDGGSMTLGFVAAAVTMEIASEPGLGFAGPVAAALLVSVPITDTALVVVSRRRRGISFLVGGRDHMTHRLNARVRSVRLVALYLALAQATLGAAALGSSYLGATASALVATGALVACAATVAYLERSSWTAYLRAPASEAAVPRPGLQDLGGARPAWPHGLASLAEAEVEASTGRRAGSGHRR